MISFNPLREYLKRNGTNTHHLYKEGIITTNVMAAINNDRPISFANLEKICRYLDIPVEKAIEIVDED